MALSSFLFVLQVAAQGSVPHSGVAMATAIVLLWTEIDGAVGSAIGQWELDVSGAEAHAPMRSWWDLAEPDAWLPRQVLAFPG